MKNFLNKIATGAISAFFAWNLYLVGYIQADLAFCFGFMLFGMTIVSIRVKELKDEIEQLKPTSQKAQ